MLNIEISICIISQISQEFINFSIIKNIICNNSTLIANSYTIFCTYLRTNP